MSTIFDPHRYTITIKLVTLEEGEHYEALVAELPDVVEYGETYDQAYALAIDSIEALHRAANEQGRDFPSPMPSQALAEFSGRVTLRMTKSLHASASKLADTDGVSLNSWIVEAVAARVGRSLAAPASSYVLSVKVLRAVSWVFERNGLTGSAADLSSEAPRVVEIKGAASGQLNTTAIGSGAITLQ